MKAFGLFSNLQVKHIFENLEAFDTFLEIIIENMNSLKIIDLEAKVWGMGKLSLEEVIKQYIFLKQFPFNVKISLKGRFYIYKLPQLGYFVEKE